MKVFSSFILCFVLLFVFSTYVSAGGFSIKSIGALDLQGTTFTHYWYTGTNPTLSGTAPANSTITLTIDSVPSSLTVDASGNWSQTTKLLEGDHTISLSAVSVTPYTFTLTIGQAPTDIGGITSPTTPAAGVGYPTIALFMTGVLFAGFSVFITKRAYSTN